MNSFTATFKKTQEEKIPEQIVEIASPRFWVQNIFKKREESGAYHRLVFKSFEIRIGNIFSSKIINK